MDEKNRMTRNLNPHKAAVVAMFIYGGAYAAQGGGSMDFWDGLDDRLKRVCRDCVARMERAPNE